MHAPNRRVSGQAAGALVLEGLLDLAHTALLARRPDGQIVAWNLAAEALFGYSRVEALALDYRDLWAQGSEESLTKGPWQGTAAFRARSGDTLEVTLRRTVSEGAEGPVFLEEIQPVRGGRSTGTVVVAHEELFAHAQRIGHFGSWEWDHRAQRLRCSAHLFRLFGLEPEAAGWSFEALLACLHPDDHAALVREGRQALDTGKPFSLELRAFAPDGSRRLLGCSGELLRDEANRPAKLMGVMQDVTAFDEARRALGESEERFRRLSELAMEGIVIHRAGTILEANAAAGRLFGYAPADLVGRSVLDLTAPESRALAQAAIGDRDTVPYEILGLRATGERFVAELHAQMIQYKGDTARVTAIRDVTERNIAQSELKRSEWRLRKAQSVARFGWWERDVASGAIALADETRAIYDLPPDEPVTVTSFLDRLHPDDRAHVGQTIARAIADHQPFAYDFRTRLGDGSYRPIHSQGEVLLGADGRALKLIGVAQDRTAQLAAESARRESEARLRAVVDQTSDLVFIKDLAGRYSLVNPSMASLVGSSADALLGKTDHEIFEPDLADAFQQADRRVLSGGQTLVFEECLAGRNLLTLKYPYRSEDGRVVGIIGISHDISERKNLESALQAQNAQLLQLDRLKVDFVNTVSHELRAPLTSVMGYAEFLEDTLGPAAEPDVLEYVAQIQKGAKRMQRLVNDLLDFALIEAGAFKLKRASADFGAKAREALDAARPLAEKAGVSLELALASDLRPFAFDAQRVEQVLTNLLSNAIRFTPAGGTVAVHARRVGTNLRCEVRDTGVGISGEDQPKLFKRFAQLKSNHRKGGTGLGLNIAKALVEAHFAPGELPAGGAVGVESRAGEGATFWFLLPFEPAAPRREPAAPNGPSERPIA